MSRPKQIVVFALFSALLLSHPGSARAAPGRDDAVVVVRGVGAVPIAADDAAEARRQARAAAARDAVVQVLAAFIDEETRAAKAGVLDAQILSQHGRLASLTRVLREGAEGGGYRVDAEFRVDRLGVVELLRRAGILPQCRVMVALGESYRAHPAASATAQSRIIGELTRAGCRVLAPDRAGSGDGEVIEAARRAGADVLVLGEARGDCVPGRVVAGFVSCRAHVAARAVFTDTGEVAALCSGDGAGADLHESLAVRKALSQAAARAMPALIQEVLLLPVRPTRRVRVGAVGLADFRQAVSLVKAMDALPAVHRAVLLSFEGGQALVHADVATPKVDGFGALLEDRELMKPFALTVQQEGRFRIRARVVQEPIPAGQGGTP